MPFHRSATSFTINATLDRSLHSHQKSKLSQGSDNKANQSISQQCLICFSNQPDTVFMECGHGGICYDCAIEIWKNTGECFLCRNLISSLLQIDLNYKNGNCIKVVASTQMVIEYEDDELENY